MGWPLHASNVCLSSLGRPSCLPSPCPRLLLHRPRLPCSSRISLCPSKASVTCAANDSREDAARKALEQALEQKKNVFKKWSQEIKSREVTIGDGDGGGTGNGGGDGFGDGGQGSGEEQPWDWGEAREVFLATSGLILLYMLITIGPKGLYQLARFFVKYVRQGFRIRKIPDDPEEFRRKVGQFRRGRKK